jgi:excisionase family DNA binding protein
MRCAMVDLTKYLTVREAAKRLDLTEERVRELILLKEIKAVKVRKWRIKPEDLEVFIKSRSNLNF